MLLHVFCQVRSMLTPASACRSQSVFTEFPSVTGLPSRASAVECTSTLFGSFFGTTPMSDFSIAYASGLWPQAFPDRSASLVSDRGYGDLPVLEHRVSTHAQGLRLRGPAGGSLSSATSQYCLPPRTTRSASRMGDFGAQWLACVFPCQLHHVQPHGYPHMTRGHNGAAPPFMWGSFIPNSMPVYPGAFGPTPPAKRWLFP
jgi:hypothetical protein